MNKRWLGIPVPIVSVILAVVLIGGVVLAGMIFSLQQQATVRIIGAECSVWANESCDEALPTTLDFGEIRAGETTDPLSIWILNSGDDTIYAAISTTDLDALLTLTETTLGVVPADPTKLAIETVHNGYIETVTTTILDQAVTPSMLNGIDVVDATAWDGLGQGVIKIGTELIRAEYLNDTSLKFLERGFFDTIAAAHSSPDVVTLMSEIEIVYALEPDENVMVTLDITADSSITRSDKPFTLNIIGYDDIADLTP